MLLRWFPPLANWCRYAVITLKKAGILTVLLRRAGTINSCRRSRHSIDRGFATVWRPSRTSPDNFVLFDPIGIGKPVVLSVLAVEVAQRFDGELTRRRDRSATCVPSSRSWT